MKALWRRMQEVLSGEGKPPDLPDPAYSYAVYWIKQVRSWPEQRREHIRVTVGRIIRHEDFEPSLYHRQYRVPGLDDVRHAGASLIQLLRVLEHFAAQSTDSGE